LKLILTEIIGLSKQMLHNKTVDIKLKILCYSENLQKYYVTLKIFKNIMLLWKSSKILCYSENLQKYYVTLKNFKNSMLLWKSSKILCYSENLQK
jgi:hypothetical protein